MKIDQNTGNEIFFALLDGLESDLEDDVDELMNDSDTELVFQKEESKKGGISNDLETVCSLKQTFKSLKIEGKFQGTGKKRVKKKDFIIL